MKESQKLLESLQNILKEEIIETVELDDYKEDIDRNIISAFDNIKSMSELEDYLRFFEDKVKEIRYNIEVSKKEQNTWEKENQ